MREQAAAISNMSVPAGEPDWQWLDYQIQLLLLVAGHKRAVALGFRNPDIRPLVADNLKQIGLEARISDHLIHTYWHVLAAKDSADLDKLEKALDGTDKSGDHTHGELSGFPDTAINAYITGQTILPTALPGTVRVSPAYAFGVFMYSQKHWSQELQTGEKWAQCIRELSPKLYKRYLQTIGSVRSGD